MNILYLNNSKAYFTNTVYDYDRSFSLYSRNDIYYFDVARNSFDIDLTGFDAIILSYALWGALEYAPESFKEKLRRFPGAKIAFFQDEYTNFILHREDLPEMGVSAIVTVMPERAWPAIYRGEFANIPKLQVLTGYIPDQLATQYARKLPLEKRKWMIGYRTRSLPPIFGKLAHEKVKIGVDMKQFCLTANIPANIEVTEEKRIYGDAWPEFIRNCRIMLGSESGSNVFDFSGEIAKKIRDYQARFPDADFWEIHNNCIGEADGIVETNQISPRIFEAMSLGTGHMLYEGDYSGILTPWKHYIPLKKDYSNLSDAMEAAQDAAFVNEMIENSYRDIVASGKFSYRAFIRSIDDFLDSLDIKERCIRPASSRKVDREICISGNRDLSGLQALEEKRVAELARKYFGRKILVYGGGEAFERFRKFFADADILAIILDDYFLKDAHERADGIPLASFEEARKLLPFADGCVVFCRQEWQFIMHGKMADLLTPGKLIDTCTLFA